MLTKREQFNAIFNKNGKGTILEHKFTKLLYNVLYIGEKGIELAKDKTYISRKYSRQYIRENFNIVRLKTNKKEKAVDLKEPTIGQLVWIGGGRIGIIKSVWKNGCFKLYSGELLKPRQYNPISKMQMKFFDVKAPYVPPTFCGG